MKETSLWSKLYEQKPTVEKNDYTKVKNYCSEVSNLLFGYYSSYFLSFGTEQIVDETEKGEIITIPNEKEIERHDECERQNIPHNHWYWHWSYVEPMHYTDCPLYSILKQRGDSGNALNSYCQMI